MQFYKKLMGSKMGKCFKIINIIKSLPEKQDFKKMEKLNKQ